MANTTGAPTLADILENDDFNSYTIANDFNPKSSGPRTITIRTLGSR